MSVAIFLGAVAKRPNVANELVREGLPSSVVSKLASTHAVSVNDLRRIIGIPASTSRRRNKPGYTLDAGNSDRAFRLAKAFVLERSVFGDVQKSQRWFVKANRNLEGEIPLSLLDTEPGTDRVFRTLMQIEHNVY